MADVGIIVTINGAREAYNSLKDIQNAIDQLNRHKIELGTNLSTQRQEISIITNEIERLNRELSQLDDKKSSAADALRSQINDWKEYRTETRNSMADTKKQYEDTRSQILLMNQTYAEMSRKKKEQDAADAKAAKDKADAEKKAAQDAADARKKAEQEAADAARKAAEAEREHMRQVQEEAQRTADSINQIAEAFNTIGKGFDIAANLSAATSRFAEGIGNAFEKMSGIFSTDISRMATRSLVHYATGAVLGSLDAITTRYDILNTFVPYMELAGVDADTANAALSRVNQSILGLPIGLDESAYRLRRYQMFLGDTDQATNLTIGLQNAITAGGANAQMRNYAYTQIDRLLAAGKLNTSRQWLSLIQGLGVSMRFISQEMGTVGMSANELAAGLTSGQIATEDFLGALMRLGEGSSDAAKQLNEALNIYKSTIESWLANVGYAYTRGGERVLDALNESLELGTGKGITDYLEVYRNSIDETFLGVAGYIRANPQMLKELIEDISDVLGVIQNIKGSVFVEKAVENLGRLGEIFTTVISNIPPGKLEEFAAFATTLAAPLGRIFSAVSSGMPYMIAVFERFKDFDFAHLVERIVEEVDRLAGIFERILDSIGDEAMTELLTFGLVYGKPLATALHWIAGGFSAIGSALGTISLIKMKQIIAAGAGVSGSAIVPWWGATGSVAGAGGVVGAGSTVPWAGAGGTGLAAGLAGGGLAAASTILAGILSAQEAGYRSEYVGGSDIPDIVKRAYALAGGSYTGAQSAEAMLRQRRSQAQQMLSNIQADIAFLESDQGRGQAFGKYTGFGYDDLRLMLPQATQNVEALDEALAAVTGTTYYVAQATHDATEEAEEASDATIELRTNTTSLATEVMEVAQAYIEVKKEAEEAFRSQLEGFEKIDLSKVNFGTARKGLGSQENVMTRYSEAVDAITDFLKENPDVNLEGLTTEILGMDIEDAVPYLEEIASSLGTKHLEEFVNAWHEREAAINRAADAYERFRYVSENNTPERPASAELPSGYGMTITERMDVVESVNRMGGTIEERRDAMRAAGVTVVEAVAEGIEDGTGKVEDAGDGIGEAVGEVANKVESTSYENYKAAYNAGSAVANGLNAALPAILSAVSAYENALNIHVRVPTVTQGNLINSVVPNRFASGGLVYASNGMFVPIGTDTIPAMLTPGEFVMKRGAVSAFGQKFMQQLNNLNIAGAFDSLIGNLHVPSSYRNVTYNTRNYDDHSSRVQNVYTNNPGFARRISNRYVRAL